MLRGAVQWATVWFFVWGVVVLAARISGVARGDWLLLGVAGFLPLALLAILREKQRLPAFAKVRADYDRLRACGGVIMAEEAADTSAWQTKLPDPAVPALRWRSGRTMGLFGLSAAFVAVALLLPERLTAFGSRPPLEVGQLVKQLQAEVQTLEQEKILDETKAKDLDQQLSKLKEDASGVDPNKTWEALDHIKESNSNAAKQAAEEALSKLNSLSQAETLAAALKQAAAGGGLGRETATRAAQDLAGMLKDAKLEDGLLKGEIPSELLSSLDGLSKEDLEKLMRALEFNKSHLSMSVSNLAKLRLISAEMLSKCNGAAKRYDPDALAAYLCSSGCTNCNSFAAVAYSYCRGGIDRGRGDAPMTWKDESDPNGAKFKEESLPPSSRLSDAELVGVSRAAPQLSGDDVVAGHGALASATSSGGSAHAQVILPRHRQAVQRFFKRDEK